MNRLAIAMLVLAAAAAVVLAVPHMHDNAVGEYLQGKCSVAHPPPECFPRKGIVPSITQYPGLSISPCHC
ncbi:MAG TPA: hypothetical protein VGG99_04900 [Acetobacteraceae bacterium]|jgi:hypothetical protein